MALKVYRSCSLLEKREVLGVFWRGRLSLNTTINAAALEYGRIAIALVIAIGLELLPIYIVSANRSYGPGELAIGAEAIIVVALARSILSYRLLRGARPS